MKRALVAVLACLTLTIGLVSGVSAEVRHTYVFSEPEVVERGGRSVVEMEGCLTVGDVGKPELPVAGVKLLLPPGQEAVGVRVEARGWERLVGEHDIAAVQREYPLSYRGPVEPEVRDEAVYGMSVPYPGELWGELQTQYVCGYGVAFLVVHPVRYVPALGEVWWCREMEVVVETAVGGRAGEAYGRMYRGMAADREQVLRLVDNAADAGAYPEGGRESTYDYLIIVRQSLASAFETLAEYKEVRGWRVKMETVEWIHANYMGDDDQDEIRDYIIDAYTQWGVKWVLLAGDDEDIPHRGFYFDPGGGLVDYDIAADLYYAALDGTWNDDGDNRWGEPGEDDLIAEVYVGRAAVDDVTETANFINKQIMYQETPVMSECATALMVGENLGWAVWGKDNKEEIRLGSSNWGYTTVGIPPSVTVQTLYDKDGTWSPMNDLLPLLNGGINLVNHLGHCSTLYALKFDDTDLTDASCTNDGVNHLHYVIYTQGCYCNSFDNRTTSGSYTRDAISEKWTTLQHGAVCFVGNTRYGWGDYSTTNGSSQYFDRQFYDGIFGEALYRIGETNQDSKHDVIPFINYAQNRWCYYELCLLGDPTLDMWTGFPWPMTLTHDAGLVVGSPYLDVTVSGVAGALVGLSIDSELVGRDTTDAGGFARVYFDSPPLVPATLDIWATAHNRRAAHSTADIIPASGPYIVYDSYQASDPLGDNDGVVEQGEAIDMTVALHNVGVTTAPAVSAVLTCPGGQVSISDDTESWGDIAAGATQWCLDDYDFAVAGGTPDGEVVTFGLAVTSGDSAWNRGFSITVSAPSLAFDGYTVDDAGGNGNGQWDPGETVDLQVTLVNNGGGDARSITGTLSEADPLVDVLSGVSSFADIAPGGSSSGTFQVWADGMCPEGHTVSFQLDLDAEGPWGETVTFNGVVGQRPVLFVDSDDETHETRLVDALDASGWGYDTWQAFTQGSVPLDTLRKYQVIVWTSGDQNVNSMSATDRINLGVYLDEGGSLFLTAENYLSAYASEPFTSDYLHVSSYTTNVTVDSVIGVAGDPIGDGIRVAADWPSGLNDKPDEIVPEVTATGMLRNGDGGPFVALRYPGSMGSSVYRVVFMTFPFEAMEPAAAEADPQLFLSRNLCWLSGDTQPPSDLTDVTAAFTPPDGVTLSWSPAWDNTGVYCYRIYRGTDGYFAAGPSRFLAEVETTYYTDTGAAGNPAVNYYYVVTAVDVIGNESGPSNRVGEVDFSTTQ
jgi:hypothetical protein